MTGQVDTDVFDESALEPGLVVPGPAVVTTPATTYPCRTRLAHRDRCARRDLVFVESLRGRYAMSDLHEFTPQEQEWVDQFLSETTLFLGPDPGDHGRPPDGPADRGRGAGCSPARSTRTTWTGCASGSSPAGRGVRDDGADRRRARREVGRPDQAVYSASGDLIHISTGGVLAFASVLHYPVRFINKFWVSDPSVGVHDGDAFIHNDARYGNIHNTDQ